MSTDELRERFERFPPEVQDAIKRAFGQTAKDLRNKESEIARDIVDLARFVLDPSCRRRMLAEALAHPETPKSRAILETIARFRRPDARDHSGDRKVAPARGRAAGGRGRAPGRNRDGTVGMGRRADGPG